MNNRKVYIQKNPNSDTRTAPKGVTKDEFDVSIRSHLRDVDLVMDHLAWIVQERGHNHDYTKLLHRNQYYKDFKAVVEGTTDKKFVDLPWYQMHVAAERHHLDANCPDDVTLIDILEMIVDRVCAGKARSGEIYSIELSNDILQRAVANTIQAVDEMVEADSDRVVARNNRATCYDNRSAF